MSQSHGDISRAELDALIRDLRLEVSQFSETSDAEGLLARINQLASCATQSKQVFDAVAEHGNDAFIQVTQDDIVVLWGGQAESIFGWNADEAMGKPLSELIIPEDRRDAHRSGIRRFIETGEGPIINHRVSMQAKHRDGEEIPVELTVLKTTPLHTDTGETQWVFSALLRDRREDEDPSSALGESKALYQTLVDNLPIHLVLKDLKGRRVFANERYLRLHNMTLDELMGKTDDDFFPKHLADKYRRDDAEVIERGSVLHSTEPYVNPDGQDRWIERVKAPVRDAQGTVTGVQLLFWDVSDRIEVDQALEKERHLLNTLLSSIPDSIYFKDRESRFIRISKSMADKFGLENTDVVIGKTDADIFTQEHAAGARADEMKIMETGVPMVGEIERETWHDKADTWCSSTKLPLVDQQGEIVGTFGISRDVTRMHRIQQELKTAKETADAANQAKSDFLANMSHEIRTPMNGIIGMAELMTHTNLSLDQRDYLLTIKDSANSLLRIINDILDFSKIEAGKLELESTNFSLRDCVGRTVQTLAIRASEKGLELACRIDPLLPDMITCDPVRLRQIVVNLVGNAIKFTHEGEVVVEVTSESPSRVVGISNGEIIGRPASESGSDSDSIVLHISVKDTGIGISEEKCQAVFEEFAQADISTTRQYGGTGLGLAITSRIVSLMDGKIWLESTLGSGTTFHFTARVGIAEEDSRRTKEDAEVLHGLPTIVVDDNTTNRQIFGEMLEAWHLAPTLVESGPSALAEMHRAAAIGEPYKLVLLDCMMPHMDGFALAECIRQSPMLGAIPIIMISSAARGDDPQRCRDMGIHRYLTKPVVQSDLFDSILDAVATESRPEPTLSLPSTPAASQTLPSSGTAFRVLLAEDGLVNQRVAMGFLHREGHEVTLAENGLEAVNAAQQDTFDLVLMDLQMPEMDGIEATHKIREHDATLGARTPIIAMTAAAMDGDRERCLDAGMDAYISKPIDPDSLRDIILEVVTACEKAEQTRQTSLETEPQNSVSPIDSHQPDENSILDLDAAAQRMPGGLEALTQLSVVLLEECPILLDQMRLAVRSDDRQLLERAAHTLKGSAEVFQARRVIHASQQLEEAARDSTGDVRELLAILQTEVDMMSDRLRNA